MCIRDRIVIELLSRRPDVAEKAIIDGSLCIPQPFMARCCIALVHTCWGLMFGKKAARRQIGAMPKMLPAKMLYPDELAELYLRDMPRLPKPVSYTHLASSPRSATTCATAAA